MVSSSKYLSLPLALAMIPSLVMAQQASTAASSLALQQAQAALAGHSSPMQDVRLLGTVMLIHGTARENGTITLLSKSDGTARTDIVVPSGTHSLVRFPQSSKNASTATEPNSTPKTITYLNGLTAANWFFPEHLLAVLTASARVSVVADPAECIVGDLCATSRIVTSGFVEQMNNGGLSEMTVSVNPQTLLPTRLDYKAHPGPLITPEIAVQVQYSGYQTIEGHSVPMQMRMLVNGSVQLDIQLTTVDLHATLTSADLNGAN